MTAPRTEDLAPVCARCEDRHLIGLPCWRGRYVAGLRQLVFTTKGRACWLGYTGCTSHADTVDHDIPRSRFGTDHIDNLVPACKHCNAARGNADPFTPDPDPQPTGVGLSPRWRTQAHDL